MEEPAYWIRTKLDKTHYKYTCSNCKKTSRFFKAPYCGSCGKPMVDDVVLNEKGDVI